MDRWLAVITCMVSVLLLAGCGASSDRELNPSAHVTEQSRSQPTERRPDGDKPGAGATESPE